MIFTPRRIIGGSYKIGLSGIWIHDHWIPFRRSNRLSSQAMSLTCPQSQLCRAAPISSFAQYPVSSFVQFLHRLFVQCGQRNKTQKNAGERNTAVKVFVSLKRLLIVTLNIKAVRRQRFKCSHSVRLPFGWARSLHFINQLNLTSLTKPWWSRFHSQLF